MTVAFVVCRLAEMAYIVDSLAVVAVVVVVVAYAVAGSAWFDIAGTEIVGIVPATFAGWSQITLAAVQAGAD